MKNLQEEIRKIVANVESSLEQPNLPTNGALNNYEKFLSNALDELRSDRLKSLYERRIEFSPEKGGEYTTEAGEFGKGIRDRVFATQSLIAAKRDAINVSNVQNNEVTRNVPQKGFSNVKKIDPPEFNGDRKKYFAFKRQWKDLVSPDLVGKARTEIAYLNKMTPERDILDNFNTMEEAWEYLDTRYGNADKISQELIDEYLKFQFKGRNDHQKLVELNEKLQALKVKLCYMNMEHQLTGNDTIINRTIAQIPGKFDNEFVVQLGDNENKPGKTKWDLLSDFLTKRAKYIETYQPNMVEEKKVDKKYCIKCKSNSHSTQDCKGKPKSEGRGSVNNVKSGNPCPHCKIVHHYFDKNRVERPVNMFRGCEAWRDAGVDEKVAMILNAGGCIWCTSWEHVRDKCDSKVKPCWKKVGNNKECGAKHFPHLHNSKNPQINSVRSGNGNPRNTVSPRTEPSTSDGCVPEDKLVSSVASDNQPVLLHMVPHTFLNGSKTVIFLDDGSTVTIITHSLAKSLNLKGVEVIQWLEVAGKEYEKLGTTAL